MGKEPLFAWSVDGMRAAYAAGWFPMAEGADGLLTWVRPRLRATFDLDTFHIPRTLYRRIRRGGYRVTHDRAFADVVAACAAPSPGREQTWISPPLQRMYGDLFAAGHAHSVEVWDDDRLAGGLFGVVWGGLFAGESMFTRVTDLGKVALVQTAAALRQAGFVLFDVQFRNPFLDAFRPLLMLDQAYQVRLRAALSAAPIFPAQAVDPLVIYPPGRPPAPVLPIRPRD